ncbi:MAG: hypothetical protein RMY28_004170 [Nostoc sp. ChiSLP01]|uniref:hypothetical protein n=1 Tax=Nostoc sp. DSM 114161 TaxID=3440143 RepID=UPI000BBC6034
MPNDREDLIEAVNNLRTTIISGFIVTCGVLMMCTSLVCIITTKSSLNFIDYGFTFFVFLVGFSFCCTNVKNLD